MSDAGWHELALIVVLLLVGVGAICATDWDGAPPSAREWGTGVMTP